MARTSVFPNSSYSPPDDSSSQEVILLALDLYCYNLDKSIGEMRSDLTRDHGESEVKLKFLEKHLQEIMSFDYLGLFTFHKWEGILIEVVCISAAGSTARCRFEGTNRNSLIPKRNLAKIHNSAKKIHIRVKTTAQMERHNHNLQDPQQQMVQPYDVSHKIINLPPVSSANLSHEQQQATSHLMFTRLPKYLQAVGTASATTSHRCKPGSKTIITSSLTYSTSRVNQLNHFLNSMPMLNAIFCIPPPALGQPMAYSYGGPVRTPQPQPPPQQQPPPPPSQHLKPAFGGPPGDGYAPAGGPPSGYMMYENESGRVQHPSQAGHFPQGGYPPTQQQASGGSGMMSRPGPGPAPPGQFMRNNPYNELIDKLVSMGYRGDHVMSVIQRLEETGQTVDFNAVLDRLNGHPSGGTQRGWSG
ncbi:bromodomain-containing protein 4 isoform X2 [Tanacetum coccineum]